MDAPLKHKNFLDRIPTFSLVLIMVIFIVLGLALIPLLDVGSAPRPRQGKTLNVSFSWPNTAPRVVEQEVTSKIEGLLSAVKGVEEVSSVSNLGSGSVSLTLKEDVNVSAVRFEISSLLKQVAGKLPEGVSYPQLSGGNIVNESSAKPVSVNLLTYRINADMEGDQIREYIEFTLVPVLSAYEDVKEVSVSGGSNKYIEVVYDPAVLSNYGLTASAIADGIKNFIGKNNIVGDIDFIDSDQERRRITLYFATGKFTKDIGEIPLTSVNGKTIYLNNLATYEYKDKLPSRYFRVNGLNTVNMTVAVDAGANLIKLSEILRAEIERIKPNLKSGVFLTLTNDASSEMQTEFNKLIKRTLLSLLILLLFVWLVSRKWKYLMIIAITLLANLATAVIAYYLLDIRLHIFSLAGITVSLGMIIDSSIIMVDHYSYYHDRKSFLAILAALLTTIGSLIVIFFMPEYIQRDLYDFSRIIIINLSVSLLVALLFVPALVERMHFFSRKSIGQLYRRRGLIRWSKFYERYIRFTQKRKGIYFAILILAFGIPFYALPGKWEKKQAYYLAGSEKIPWYQAAYNATFGSLFFQNTLKEPISKIFGGSMRLFASKLDSRTYAEKERDVILTVRAQMPLGGSIHHLNEKVARLEKFLARFDEIKRFETRVESAGARVTVEFKDEHEKTYFPYYLENLVIGEVLSIGGADWSTSGVSPRGFSNSLNLGHRSDRIILSGYNYLRLYKYAEEISATLSQNRRVNDLIIENVQGKEVEEMYLDFDRHRIALYQFNVGTGYRALQELLTERNLGRFTSDFITGDLVLKSSQMDRFDVWHLLNSYVKAGDRNFPLSAFGQIGQRTAKNSIPKKNQEYTLTVSFNYIGSFESRNKYVNEVIEHYNEKVFPVGYHCENSSYGWYRDDGTQYWLILLIVVIIFFLCAILFESLSLPFVIISLIPVSFIGTFLTFYFSGINFGTGGFASLVLLCGIVVNSGIYVVNEYKDTRLRNQERGLEVSRLKMYLKAYNHKIIPVFLTVLSTVLGLVPFFIDSETDDFWFSFAVGTTGGLLFSIVALVFVMPIFMPLIKRNRPRRKG